MYKYLCILLLLHSFPHALMSQSLEETDGIKIVLMSDLNESYGSTHYGEFVDSTMAYINAQQPDLVLFAGDMVAGQSLRLSEEDLYAMWDGFDETIGKPMREMDIPFAFTLGNHDASKSGNFDHEREIAKEYWSSHKPELSYQSDENFPFYYSFLYKDLFVLSWDASGHIMTEEELKWIEEQLSSDEAKNASIRLMVGHLPLYAVANGRNKRGEVLRDADQLLELMTTHHLDYYFSGHHHAWYPARKNGLKMIHSGAQGSGPRSLIGSDREPRRTLTLLQKHANATQFDITTFDMHNNMRVISPEELPASIEGFNGKIERYNHDN